MSDAGSTRPSFEPSLGDPGLDTSFARGFYTGFGRAASAGLQADFGQLLEAEAMGRSVLLDSGLPLAAMGVELFAEWTSLAATVRVAHGENPLGREQLDAFVKPAYEFLNTLFCPPPR